eukprot:CAMPEP_0182558226 /NCGR_PEP_ID=MMETSP1324-20130603/1854_1 /TAXON_ID=236786 /ORGANISM="Florenciella sp., Strain RCC1587" /LENGTH=144 /DNA_ID=CAMNT_0024770393 /DNA_START=44 /DNA_END=478 /DNA_ORIENTATION=-
MAPPIHIKLISGVLNTIVLIAGIRNMVAPGTPLVVIPEDDIFQAHFGAASDPKMAHVFQLFGVFMIMAACTKHVTVFGHSEGTFLRKKLFFVLGLADIACAAIVFQYNAPGSKGFAVLHGLEGVAFIADAALRKRLVKTGSKKS